MSGVAADPISAIANAAGSMFATWGEGLKLLGLGTQKKIVKEQTKQAQEATKQTAIQGRTSFLNNVFGLASLESNSKTSSASANRNLIMIIVGAVLLIIAMSVILKKKQ